MATFTATNHTLDKLENLLKSAGFRLRYEKGNFKTGACLLQSSRVIVVNKFSNLESKIEALTSLIAATDIEEYQLDEKQRILLKQIKQLNLQL